MHKFIILVFNPAPPTSTHPHFVFTSLHLHTVKHRKRVMRFDATRHNWNVVVLINASESEPRSASCFIMRTLSFRRARRVQCDRAAFACVASRAYQRNSSCQYLPVCSLQMRHVRNIFILWQTQIRSSSWSYSYSLSLCPEPLLFLKKKKLQSERKRETAKNYSSQYHRAVDGGRL